MREIKFRAWDKVNKKWIYGFLNIAFFDCSFNPKGIDGTEPENLYLENLVLSEWQQYTSLKDKNGKEIYEGDIIKYISDAYPFTSKVVFDYGCFVLSTGSLNKVHLKDIKICEIIGNIYENPKYIK